MLHRKHGFEGVIRSRNPTKTFLWLSSIYSPIKKIFRILVKSSYWPMIVPCSRGSSNAWWEGELNNPGQKRLAQKVENSYREMTLLLTTAAHDDTMVTFPPARGKNAPPPPGRRMRSVQRGRKYVRGGNEDNRRRWYIPLVQTPHLKSKCDRVLNTTRQLIPPPYISSHPCRSSNSPPPPPRPRPPNAPSSSPPKPPPRHSTTCIASAYIYAT